MSSPDECPDEFDEELRVTLAEHLGATPEEVAVGDSTPALFRRVLRYAPGGILFVAKQEEPRPRILEGLRATSAPTLEELALLIDASTSLIFIPSPQTPSGEPITGTAFGEFMAQVPNRVTVVLDEAYLDYGEDEQSVVSLREVRRFPNLVALRSYKKDYGFSGVRVHYALGGREIIAALNAQVSV